MKKDFEKILSSHDWILFTAFRMACEEYRIKPKNTEIDKSKIKKALGYTWYLDDEKN